MLRVVLDTNALWGDMLLRSPDASFLLRAAAHEACAVHLSPVVVAELHRLHARGFDEAQLQIRKSIDGLRKRNAWRDEPHGMDATIAALDGLASDYPTALSERLGSSGIVLDDWPAVRLEDLVSRDLSERRPFRRSNKKTTGMRDTLIWLGVVQVAVTYPHDDVVLVTNNVQDFAQPKEGQVLHQHLQDDLRDAGVAAGQVELVSTLGELVREYGSELTNEAEASIRWRLTTTLDSFNSKYFVEEASYSTSYNPRGDLIAYPDVDLQLPAELIDIQVQYVEPLYDLEYQASDEGDGFGYRCTYNVPLEVEAFMYKWDIADLDQADDVAVIDPEWNRHMMFVTSSRTVRVVADAEMDPDSGEVIDVHPVSVDLVAPTEWGPNVMPA